jgi:pimeloyl-ACP methyl ester carboxylesterase
VVRRALAAALLVLSLGACTSDPGPRSQAAAVSPTPSAEPVASDTLWLCRPGMPENPCEGGLDATVVDGSGQVERFAPPADPPLDCFYAYPTVSRVTALNAPMEVTPELVAVARAQAARFGEVCRVFAPVYRQITLSGIFTGHYDDTSPRAMAERDVELAWRDYLANHNDGRGVVLLGHSQGARTLTSLLAKRIEPSTEARTLLVSALLLGGDVTVERGKDVGGSFEQVPACRQAGQVGCVVAYSSFGEAPPADAVFGRAREAGEQVLCVDPSRLTGSGGTLHPYLPGAALSPESSLAATVPGVRTGFAAYPEQLTAECRVAGPVSYLHVARAPGARLPVTPQPLGPRWGLHNGDVNLALGDLVEVVRRQAESVKG